MKKNIKSLFVVLVALVFGLSLNYLYGAYGPTTPAPGLPTDLPVITEIYKIDNVTNYWQEKGSMPAGMGINGSLLDVSQFLKSENLLIFKNLIIGTTSPKSLAINALTSIGTEQNVCSITPEGKIVLCDPAPQTPNIAIQFGDVVNGSCSATNPGNVTVVVNNPTTSPMSIKYKKYAIGHDSYDNTDYNYQSGAAWVQQVVSTTTNPYVFTTPAQQSCFLSYDSVMLVEVTIEGQLYIDTASIGMVRGAIGDTPQCAHCDPGADQYGGEGGLN